MVRSRCLLLALPWWGGCVRELPDSAIGAAAVDLFRAFDDEPEALPVIVAELDAAMEDFYLTAPVPQRLVDLPPLTAADYGGADVPAGAGGGDQMDAGIVGLSSHGLDENLEAQVQVNMTCANARAVTCHRREADEGSDAAAFVDGVDDVFRAENTIRIETLPLDFWIRAPGDFRRVSLADGRKAAVGRTWIRETFDNDSGRYHWKQRFGVDVFVEDPTDRSRTRRFYGTWVGPSVNGFVGAFVQKAIRSGLDDGFVRPDEWLDGDRTCDVDLADCLSDSPF